MAETLKYLYLLFLSDDPIPLDKWVFNTSVSIYRHECQSSADFSPSNIARLTHSQSSNGSSLRSKHIRYVRETVVISAGSIVGCSLSLAST